MIINILLSLFDNDFDHIIFFYFFSPLDIVWKFRKLGLNKFVKKQNITKNDLRKATKLHNKSLDDLKKTAGIRKIKNYGDL